MTHVLPPAVLTKLGNLEAVSYRTHEATPEVIYLLAWDDRSQNQVCWAIAEHVSFEQAIMLAKCAGQITDAESKNTPDLEYDWLIGIAAVSLVWYGGERFIEKKTLSPSEHSSIVAAARGGA